MAPLRIAGAAAAGTLALGALAAAVVPGDEVAFHPADGTTLTKRFALKTDLTLDDSSFVFNEQELDGAPEEELTFSFERTVVVTDEYVESGVGRPTKLERTFDEVGSRARQSMGGDHGDGQAEESDLQDTTVVFTWDEDEAEFGVEFHEDEDADEDLLEEVWEDMDLRGLLPDDEVEEGDSWEIDASALAEVLVAGGDLSIGSDERELPDMEGERGAIMIVSPEPPTKPTLWVQDLRGDVEATYKGTTEVDGVDVAEIHIELEVDSDNDVVDYMTDMVGGMYEYDDAALEVSIEGEATLYWNAEAGHFHSFELEADLEVAFEAYWSIDAGGHAFDLQMTQELSGEMELEVGLEDE